MVIKELLNKVTKQKWHTQYLYMAAEWNTSVSNTSRQEEVHVCDGEKRTALQSFTPGIIISLKFIVYYCDCALFLTYIKKINKKIIK